jgi:hypothetical protein
MGLAAPEQNQPKGTRGSRDGREVEVTP